MVTLNGKYWTVYELAKHLGKVAQTVRNMIHDGRIRGAVKFALNENKQVYLIPDRSIRRLAPKKAD